MCSLRKRFLLASAEVASTPTLRTFPPPLSPFSRYCCHRPDVCHNRSASVLLPCSGLSTGFSSYTKRPSTAHVPFPRLARLGPQGFRTIERPLCRSREPEAGSHKI